jgi:putative transposase
VPLPLIVVEDRFPSHGRRSVRVPGYDYTTPGAYFVTICAHDRACLFGEIVEGTMRVNEYGSITREAWWKTAETRAYVALQAYEYIVMPNHIHGIIRIVGEPEATPERFGKPVRGSIPTIVRAFKSATTRRINVTRGISNARVWQTNYFEHIIRDDEQMHRIRRYIADNPARWDEDEENPLRASVGARRAVPTRHS